MAKCFNLMASVDHIKTKLRNSYQKIKLAGFFDYLFQILKIQLLK